MPETSTTQRDRQADAYWEILADFAVQWIETSSPYYRQRTIAAAQMLSRVTGFSTFQLMNEAIEYADGFTS